MRIKYSSILILSVVTLVLLFSSCKKDKLLTSGGSLKFSVDTLMFDTVFTAQASFTLSVKIFNEQNQKINISSVRLQNGGSSFFNLNVDGFPGNNISNLELAAHDSIYVFATVNIDPTNENNPFLIEDKLIATLNGKDFSIPVEAFGQNAHYIVDSTLTKYGGTITWLTDKPYVILHNALVDSATTLVIPPRCRIYMNADSRLLVDGTLIADAPTKADSIVFQGDRLDRAYFGGDLPGEWGGLYYTQNSTGNVLNHVVLKNCGNSTTIAGIGTFQPAAIQVNGTGVSAATPQLTMKHTIVQNAIGFGLLCFAANNVVAENCLIHTTGAQAMALLQGGNYTITNCSFINYKPVSVSHTDNPTIAVRNYFDTSDAGYIPGNLNAVLTNCLVYGSLQDEVLAQKKGTATYNVQFLNCALTTSQSTDAIDASTVLNSACIFNQDAQLTDYAKWDFRPKASSPLAGAGTNTGAAAGITDDLNGDGRNIPLDIGCYNHTP
ncbi:right-handed parallel beta-helix repeat-containing protein [Chitinophagaceae bacterium MMS25-I14]